MGEAAVGGQGWVRVDRPGGREFVLKFMLTSYLLQYADLAQPEMKALCELDRSINYCGGGGVKTVCLRDRVIYAYDIF